MLAINRVDPYQVGPVFDPHYPVHVLRIVVDSRECSLSSTGLILTQSALGIKYARLAYFTPYVYTGDGQFHYV
jgi:hypothetical protein